MDSAGPQDLYSLTPMPEKIDETTRQLLVEKARNFEDEYKNLKNSEFFQHNQFYIVSARFLERWKVYVGYQQANGGKSQYQKFFGSGLLPVINQDIVESVNNFDIVISGKNQYLNVVMKPGLQEGKDYVFATRQMWHILTRQLQSSRFIQVKRKVIQTEQGKKVQLYFQKFTIIPITHKMLQDIEHEKISNLTSYSIQISRIATVQQLGETFKQQIYQNKLPYQCKYKVDKRLLVKFWLAPEKSEKKILCNTFLQGCKANPTFTYKLYFQGTKLDSDKKIMDYDIFQDSLVLMQFKQDKTEWCFYNKSNPLTGSCSNCRQVQRLDFFCSCKSVAYCSKNCKLRDKRNHQNRCPNNAQSDQQQKQLKLTQQSRRGIVGLRNLGNTCFMNSGMQCISHIIELTEYFLSNKYLNDINKDNPLGTKGQLCMAFAHMLKTLWYGTQTSFSPTQVKRAIGKFQPMFSGYNQHDSGQLITYMLDGLHEDLNRIKKKPYVESKDYDGRPDNIISAQQWENFLKRNQSQIVDLMYGQFKSAVDCPKCAYHSIQFDPFCMCSLPLTNNSLKKLQIIFLQRHIIMHKTQVFFDKAWNWTMKDIAEELKKKINKNNVRLMFYVGSYSTCEYIDLSRKANQVRNQYKYRNLYARIVEDDQLPGQGVKVVLGITGIHSYYKDESYRRSISPYRLYYFNQNLTLKEVHQKIHKYYKQIYPISEYQQEVIKVSPEQKPFKLLSIATSKYSQCEYCFKKSCDGCQIPYTDMTLKQFVKEVDNEKIEFQFYCRKNDKEAEKKFDGEGYIDNDSNLKASETTLKQCFKLFSQPETLAEDNAWYCPRCKDFVLARKQMQIYKAPKILILCLKRFKRKQYFQQKHSIVVDFPIQDLDLSQFVINKSLPADKISMQQQKSSSQGPLLYDLFAISNHYGSTGGGHYTAYCKNPINGEWYDFDDSSVSRANKNNLVSENAYILFYRRKN